MNCLDCIYSKLDYDHDGYTPLVVCRHTGFQATWSSASSHCCKSHIQDKLIVADGFFVNTLARKRVLERHRPQEPRTPQELQQTDG